MGALIGIDEVGRGCLAGPLLVVAARTKQHSDLPVGLKDSKLLSRQQRIKILNMLSICCEFGEGWVKCSEIDKLGLGKALKLGVRRALRQLIPEINSEIIIDGKVNYIPKKYQNTKAIVDADNLIPIVSAASIYAKVKRDNYMFALAQKHPLYNFESHVGYGTRNHLVAIKNHGALKYIHRFSFQPVYNLSRTNTGI